MEIQDLPDDVLFVVLPKEPQLRRELATINETVINRGNCDVVIDFSVVEILTSSSISNLMILRKSLSERGRRLILCNVGFLTKCIFRIAGLSAFFDFAGGTSAALAAIQSPGKAKNAKLSTAGRGGTAFLNQKRDTKNCAKGNECEK